MNMTSHRCYSPCRPSDVLAGFEKLETQDRIGRTLELAAYLVEDAAYEIAKSGATPAVTKLILLSRDLERFLTAYGYDTASSAAGEVGTEPA